ncbi:hypothetical protein CLV75_3677 [Ruegeria conchae]|uniref:Uncharacterized protein n=1 Tax=Ruegeria conchae TaxID=981384 RepID=A0A497Z2C3_9RHOB|nr:hypothetical protein CLV75_3677 [Ruegeria conchae]
MKSGDIDWQGSSTWLDIVFFSPVVIFGFTFGKDENFIPVWRYLRCQCPRNGIGVWMFVLATWNQANAKSSKTTRFTLGE